MTFTPTLPIPIPISMSMSRDHHRDVAPSAFVDKHLTINNWLLSFRAEREGMAGNLFVTDAAAAAAADNG